MVTLSIDSLCISIDAEKILSDISFSINEGEIHALLGPNGSGKSSLAQTIAGNPDYQSTGTLLFLGQNITTISADERARRGIFLAFQHPVSLPGVEVFSFLRAVMSTMYPDQSIALEEFKHIVYAALNCVGLDSSFAYRNVNEGFSGGERKRLEIAQALLLKPTLLILDEVDSGLDIDALKLIGEALQKLKNDNPSMAMVVITHHHKLFNFLFPTHVHLLANGKCTSTKDLTLLSQIEEYGYDPKK